MKSQSFLKPFIDLKLLRILFFAELCIDIENSVSSNLCRLYNDLIILLLKKHLIKFLALSPLLMLSSNRMMLLILFCFISPILGESNK